MFDGCAKKLRRQVDPEATVNLLPAVELEVPADDWDWESSNEKRYSLVVARVSWYEIHTQLRFQSEFLPFRSGDFHTGVKALAIKQNIDLPQLAAHLSCRAIPIFCMYVFTIR